MRIKELENLLEGTSRFNSKITNKALIMGSKAGFARFNAMTKDGILWLVRDMINPENHKKRWMTRMEMLIYFNGLVKQGYDISII